MSLSRRKFLQLCSAASCISVFPLKVQAERAKNLLFIPPLQESISGKPIFLAISETTWSFDKNKKATVLGINNQYLGPTVRVQSNSHVKVIYVNQLDEPIAMTVAGLQQCGQLNGGPSRLIMPKQQWAPVLPITQPEATCWYHSCTPQRMAHHLYQGIAGMWIVRDDFSQQLPLPNHYGVDDIPVIIQDKRFNNLGEQTYITDDSLFFFGDTLIVNGKQDPYIDVPRGLVRLRLLNASNTRRYILSFNNQQSFYVIASDLGLLKKPIQISTLALAPGERKEIIVDVSKGKELILQAGRSAGVVERIRGWFEYSKELISTNVLTLKPTKLLSLMTNQLPAQLANEFTLSRAPEKNREFLLGDIGKGINDKKWDKNRIDVNVKQGSWECWKISSEHPQTFHIQGAAFLVTKVNGALPMEEDRGWKDTVWVDGDVEIMIYFPESSERDFPFLFYSQIPEIADTGAIGQIVVYEHQLSKNDIYLSQFHNKPINAPFSYT